MTEGRDTLQGLRARGRRVSGVRPLASSGALVSASLGFQSPCATVRPARPLGRSRGKRAGHWVEDPIQTP